MKKQLYFIFFVFIFSVFAIGQVNTNNISHEVIPTTNKKEITPSSSQMEIINKSFDRLVENITKEEKKNKSMWDTLIPLLIGAFLALIPQIFFWFLNKWKETSKLKLDIKADLNRLEHLLCDHYRELAMHKAHKPYWYAQYENSQRERNEEETKKFYLFHIESGNKVRETEIKISATFSEFYGQVIKLQHLTNFDSSINNLIEKYYQFAPVKPNQIDSTIHDLPAEENKEEKRLRDNYEGFTKPIKEIVQILNKK